MELTTPRLEASTRIQERPSSGAGEERRRQAPRRHKQDPPAEAKVTAEEQSDGHQLDDLA